MPSTVALTYRLYEILGCQKLPLVCQVDFDITTADALSSLPPHKDIKKRTPKRRVKETLIYQFTPSPNPQPQLVESLSAMSSVSESSSDLSEGDQNSNETPFPAGVVDSIEDKKDEHSTRKRPYNTLGPDTDPESDHGPRKHPHNGLGSESELVGVFEDNSTSAQKGNDSHHNSEVSDTRAESKQSGVLQKGYAMMCDFCGVENCRSGYNKPVLMVCYLCSTYGKHWPKNCPSGLYRGAPMPEQYGCFYWMNSNSTGA